MARQMEKPRWVHTTRTISWVVVGLMAVSGIAGIVFQSQVYPTEELAQAFLVNDVLNLVVGIPVMLVPLWLANKRKLTGVLLWPGALFYVVYNYLIYALAMPLNLFYLFFPVMVGLAAIGILLLLKDMDVQALQTQLGEGIPAKLGGGVLILLGIGFISRAVGMMAGGNQTHVEMAIHISDIVLSIGWVVGGISLWRRTAFGYAGGGGLLYQGCMLFLAVIAAAIVQPLMFELAIVWMDVIVLAVMAFVVVIPFTLFVRAVKRTN